jgi:hypothetical protein
MACLWELVSLWIHQNNSHIFMQTRAIEVVIKLWSTIDNNRPPNDNIINCIHFERHRFHSSMPLMLMQFTSPTENWLFDFSLLFRSNASNVSLDSSILFLINLFLISAFELKKICMETCCCHLAINDLQLSKGHHVVTHVCESL